MTTNTFTPVPVRLDVDAHAPVFAKAMTHLDHAATKQLDSAGIDHRLRELLRLRVSQLNGCAYCVDMHAKNARAVGEHQLRLDALPVWRETPFFSDAERAALAFAEAMVAMADTHVPTVAFEALAEHYAPDEIGALVALVVTVSAWNAIGVSTRACAWRARDFDRLRTVLADDVTFRGPLGTADNAEEAIAGLRGMAENVMTDIDVQVMAVDGQDVVTWFELHSAVAAPVPTVNWSHVENGLITGIRLTFDPRPLLAQRHA